MIISAFAAVALLAAATTMLPSRSPATSRASRNRGHDVIAELRAATGVNKFPIEEFADRPWSIRPRPGIDAGPAATPERPHFKFRRRLEGARSSINRALTILRRITGLRIYGMLRISAYLSPMDHQRIVPRRRILKAGSIECGGEAIACNVRNLSETGAALEALSPLYIPDRFTLVVRTDQLKRPCHVIWRKEKRVGVAFD